MIYRVFDDSRQSYERTNRNEFFEIMKYFEKKYIIKIGISNNGKNKNTC